MCDALKGADRLSFSAEVLIDEVLPRGQRIQYEGIVAVSRDRQNAMRADITGDVHAERIIYNGNSLTIEHTEDHVYSTVAAPPTLDAALDEAAQRYGIVIPFADLLYSDPEAILTENAISGSYLGVHAVRGEPCHHVAFSTPHLDWQVWIDQGEPAVPRKLVITYVYESGSPQYVGVFTSWELAATFEADLFTFTPQDGEQPIELLEVVRQ